MAEARNDRSALPLRTNSGRHAASLPTQGTSKGKPNPGRTRFDKRLYDRSNQESELLRLYRSLSSSAFSDDDTESQSNFILISGPVGAGKTALAKTIRQHVVDDGGYFIVGKFDQMQRPEPYAAFVAAFTEFTNLVLARGDESVALMKEAIDEAIHSEGRVLTDAIPALEKIIGQKSEPVNACGSEAIMRFLYVFRSFVRAVCSAQTPLVLLLDDLQWADKCSLDLLASLLSDESTKGVIFIATSREDSDDETSHLSGFFGRLRMEKVIMSKMSVTNLENDAVHEMVGELFNLQYNSTHALAELVYHKTKGNVFNIIEFLRALQDDNLLTYDNDTRQWTWDDDDVHLTVDCHNIDDLLVGKVEQLSSSLQELLKVAACLGSTLDEALLSHALSAPVSSYLAMAADCGLLTFDEQCIYTFAHDRIQEAAYSLIRQDEKDGFHIAIGRKLAMSLSSEELDKHIYVVLNQFSRGSSLIKSQREKNAIAALCLRAGKKAVAASSFRTASTFLNFGISLLGDNHWREEYDLSLSLYDASAEVAYCTANFSQVDAMVSAVLHNARCFHDKVQAHATQVYALGARDKMQDAIDSGLAVLRELGDVLPSHPKNAYIALELMRTKLLLRGKSNEAFLRLPQMSNREKVSAMQILNLMFLSAYLARPQLAALIAMRMVRLSVLYGLSAMSSLGFAVYGMVLSGGTGAYTEGYRYGQLSLALLEKFHSNVWVPRVYAVVYGAINGWVRPIEECLEPLRYAYQIGLESGDIEFALVDAHVYCFVLYYMGKPLPLVKDETISILRVVKTYKQESAYRMILPFLHVIRSLMGETTMSEWDVNQPNENQPNDGLEITPGPQNVMCEFWFYCYKMTISYIFGEYSTAAEEADICRDNTQIPDEVGIALYLLFDGLILHALCKRSHTRRRKHLRIIRRRIRQLKKLAQLCPQNCLSKACLLQAELAALVGNHTRAYSKYTYAIALASDSSMIMEHAVANERAGRYMLERGDENAAIPYFRQAYSSYIDWGATSKVKLLKDELACLS